MDWIALGEPYASASAVQACFYLPTATLLLSLFKSEKVK